MTTKTPTKPADKTDTKERLIEAGTQEFAEHGFAAASIRRICSRAGANPAAINYHFGDKQRFYTEVLVTSHMRTVKKRRMPTLADDPEHPEEMLRAWVRWFLGMLLAEGKSSLGKLMARELFQPTPALDELIQRSVRPITLSLGEIIAAILDPVPPGGVKGEYPADPGKVIAAVHSVLGQCLFYKHAQPALERLQHLAAQGEMMPPVPMDMTTDEDALARHIADFSLAGLEKMRAGRNGDAT